MLHVVEVKLRHTHVLYLVEEKAVEIAVVTVYIERLLRLQGSETCQ